MLTHLSVELSFLRSNLLLKVGRKFHYFMLRKISLDFCFIFFASYIEYLNIITVCFACSILKPKHTSFCFISLSMSAITVLHSKKKDKQAVHYFNFPVENWRDFLSSNHFNPTEMLQLVCVATLIDENDKFKRVQTYALR